ncbi:restriction endonuclease subunit S [Fusobacterium gonidiaformans]|uniref:restriction endonuclease subunit S n=1 Tax=Fusobacterium gonidiaformans TaxID=849 RepID=UPI0001BC63E3|nr:restriction endonuclease subunit S [Fusobacterium gonidiaformans]AVQ17365.1 restriction endonuclease subunit S [Fusobacterium gonidiaformans ATCC 25563]EFS27860.1 hypothetical protein FGAG_00181 [Fusobacterium gonidiaformans ATCC 25563]
MAKKKELTIEEKLQAALVSKEEQPYEIPDSWVWVRLGSICEINMGQSPLGKNVNFEKGIGLIGGPSDMGEQYPDIKRYTIQATKLSTLDDIIVSIRATLGKAIFSDGKYCLGRGVCAIKSKSINPVLLKYYFMYITDYLYQIATGTTFAQISKEDVYNLKFAFSSLSAQQRIVKKLDFLFEKTKKAKKLLQEVKEEIEMRKISILNKAFRGELTKNWREENKTGSVLDLLQEIQNEKMKKWEEECREAEKNGSKKPKKIKLSKIEEMIVPKEEEPYKIPDTWKWVRLREVTENNQYGYTSKSTLEGKIKYLRITDIQNENVDWDTVPYIVEENNNISQFFLRKNDIVIARTGSTTGKSYRIDKIEDVAVFASYLIRIRVIKINSEYLLRFTHSNVYWNQIIELSSGIAQPGVNAQKLENLYFPLPPLEEQQEIVRVLEEVLEKEKKVKELIDLEEQIELLEKSILDKAFRGKLGTQDINDEPALELLKKIIDKEE